MTTQRQQQVADLIHRQLGELIRKEVHDPRLAKISLTAVSVSPDLKQAKVFYTVLKEEDRKPVQEALSKATGYFRHLVAQAIALRYVPYLNFLYDESLERAAKISSLIDKVMIKDEDSKE